MVNATHLVVAVALSLNLRRGPAVLGCILLVYLSLVAFVAAQMKHIASLYAEVCCIALHVKAQFRLLYSWYSVS